MSIYPTTDLEPYTRFIAPIKHYKPREWILAYEAMKRGVIPEQCIWNFRLDPPLRPRRPEETEWEYLFWHFLRSKEIDAVCFAGDEVWLVEFKDRLRPSGVGQLLVYR